MSPRRDPDAHLGPRARASNREERALWWRWLSIGYSVLAAAFVILAIAPGRSTTNRVLAVCWVGLAVFSWWNWARVRPRNSLGDEGSEGGSVSRRRGVSKGMAIFGVVSCLALAVGWLFVAMRRDGEGLSVVFVVCHVALAGGWLWRYRQATNATSAEELEGGG